MNLLHFLHIWQLPRPEKLLHVFLRAQLTVLDCFISSKWIKMVQRLHHNRMFPPPNGNKYPTTAMVRCSPLGLIENVFFDIGFLFLRISIWQKNSSAVSIEFWNSQEIGLSNVTGKFKQSLYWDFVVLIETPAFPNMCNCLDIEWWRLLDDRGTGMAPCNHHTFQNGPDLDLWSLWPKSYNMNQWACGLELQKFIKGTPEQASLSTMPLQEIRRLVQALQW